MRRFFFGVAGVLSLIFLLQVLLSGIGRADDIQTGGSWYDEVGIERGILPSADFSADEALEEGIAPTSSACAIEVLKNLGWTVERVNDSTEVNYSSGNPCDNASLAESQAQGELRVRIPHQIDDARLNRSLRAVLGSEGAVCAYKFRLGDAAVRAARGLQANRNFYFYAGGYPFVQFSRPEKWVGSCSNGSLFTCFFPRYSNSDTMNEFYVSRIGTECALGLQVAEYATLRELFGDVGFDTSFQKQEIAIAPWNVLNSTSSATWGATTASQTTVDRDASQTARKGARAFLGFSGYIGNVFGEGSLDHPVDRGENFMTVSVSLAAGAELMVRGGFAHFNRVNHRIYELGRLLSVEQERLALTRQDARTVRGTDAQRRAFAELQQILANPVYSEYRVFVHPLGIMSLGEHLVRLLERNPRTPYSFQLYPSRHGRSLYVRYVNRLLRGCGR